MFSKCQTVAFALIGAEAVRLEQNENSIFDDDPCACGPFIGCRPQVWTPECDEWEKKHHRVLSQVDADPAQAESGAVINWEATKRMRAETENAQKAAHHESFWEVVQKIFAQAEAEADAESENDELSLANICWGQPWCDETVCCDSQSG